MMHRKADSKPENTNGYVWVYVGEDYPGAMSNGYMYEHRYVMSKILNRPLRDTEQVRHKDGNQKNNTPNNLELWIYEPNLDRYIPKSIADAKEDDYKRSELESWKKREEEKKRRDRESISKGSSLRVVRAYLANGSNI